MKRAALPSVLAALLALGCEKKAPPSLPDASPAPLTAAQARARAEQAIASSCGVCHSLDMVYSQRLTRAQWEKELKKMVGWGAVMADDDARFAVDLLSESAGTDAGPFAFASIAAPDVAASVATSPLPAGADPARGEAKYKSLCASCHGEGAKGAALGPNLTRRPIAFRYAEFERVVKEGRARMPPFASVLDSAQIADVAAFVQSR
jgi:mono/diheme cytochrome c family protein